jgi:hypothetical protein
MLRMAVRSYRLSAEFGANGDLWSSDTHTGRSSPLRSATAAAYPTAS